jgi:hypothetical protein
MVTMVDEIFDRGYQAARTQLNASVAKAFGELSQTIGDGLRALHRLDWNAPWAAPKKPARRV